MAETVEYVFAGGGGIAIEVRDADAAVAVGTRDAFGDAAAQVTQNFDAALASLRKVAESLHSALNTPINAPDSVTVQFGVNFSVKSGLVIVEGTGGASLNITMSWKKP